MKGSAVQSRYLAFMAACAVSMVCLQIPEALAAEQVSMGRKVWDHVMLFINFGILVFLFFKYGRSPLMNYLRGVQSRIGQELNRIQEQKVNARNEMSTEEEKMKEKDQITSEIRNSLLELGRIEQEKIVEQARLAAERMVQNARSYADYKTAMVRKAIRDDMVIEAISIVEERLKKTISENDHDRLIQEALQDLRVLKEKNQE